jgi:general secretion pathway protein H
MQTSAIGSSKGFTLVELMVVIAILALTIGIVTLALPDQSGKAGDEADKVAARLSLTRDMAIAGAQSRTMVFEGDTQSIAGEDMRRWQLADGLTLNGARAIRFSATGETREDVKLSILGVGERAEVIISAGGDIRVAR